MIEGLICKTPQGEVLRVREVWESNLDDEMAIIRNVVETHPFLAMDTEFPGVVVKPVGSFKSSGEFTYQTMRTNVDMLKLIQLGLTFSDAEGNLPKHNDELCVWQFNFREFDPKTDIYHPESVRLLTESGIDFEQNVERGVNVQRFAELLITSGVVLNDEVQWITFHSGYDFGYLLKLLTCEPLPLTEEKFKGRMRLFFPSVYDIKYLMKFCELHGGLQKVADHLAVERIGPQHQAGSDSLLTNAAFMKLVQTQFSGLENVLKHKGVLFGLGTDGEREMINVD